MSDKQYKEIQVCIDCLYVLANGIENEDERMAAEGMERTWPSELYNLTINCPEGCEGHFSWEWCEGCENSLGGDRHPVMVWNR